MNFKQFFEASLGKEEEKNIKDTLKKLPKKHRALVKGFKFKFLNGNTLKNDKQHVGYMMTNPKEIAIAAPWRYPREFTFLHEIAHLVWAKFVDENKRKEWKKIVDNTKNRQHQSDEELFCMAYANHYGFHKIEIHNHNNWNEFIKKL